MQNLLNTPLDIISAMLLQNRFPNVVPAKAVEHYMKDFINELKGAGVERRIMKAVIVVHIRNVCVDVFEHENDFWKQEVDKFLKKQEC